MYKNFLNAYQDFWLKATNFKSKTTRSDWWRVQLVNIIISVITIPIFLLVFDNLFDLISRCRVIVSFGFTGLIHLSFSIPGDPKLAVSNK